VDLLGLADDAADSGDQGSQKLCERLKSELEKAIEEFLSLRAAFERLAKAAEEALVVANLLEEFGRLQKTPEVRWASAEAAAALRDQAEQNVAAAGEALEAMEDKFLEMLILQIEYFVVGGDVELDDVVDSVFPEDESSQ